MIGRSIYSLLNQSTALTSLVGSRIYPIQAPQTASDPMLIYGIVETKPTDDKQDVSHEDWIQIDLIVYAKDYDTMHDIAIASRQAMDGYSGNIGGNEISQIRFQNFTDGWETSRESYSGVMEFLIIAAV